VAGMVSAALHALVGLMIPGCVMCLTLCNYGRQGLCCRTPFLCLTSCGTEGLSLMSAELEDFRIDASGFLPCAWRGERARGGLGATLLEACRLEVGFVRLEVMSASRSAR